MKIFLLYMHLCLLLMLDTLSLRCLPLVPGVCKSPPYCIPMPVKLASVGLGSHVQSQDPSRVHCKAD